MEPQCACAECFFCFCFFRDTLLSTFFQQQLMEPCHSILYLYCTVIYCNINNGCPDDALDIFCKPLAVNFRNHQLNHQLGIYFRVRHQKFKRERQQTIITFLVLIDYWPLLLHGAIALLSFIITILYYYVFLHCFWLVLVVVCTTMFLFVDPMLPPSGSPFKCHEEVLSLQPMIPPKYFDIFPLLVRDAQKV